MILSEHLISNTCTTFVEDKMLSEPVQVQDAWIIYLFVITIVERLLPIVKKDSYYRLKVYCVLT